MNVNKFIISKKISSRYLVHKILNGVFIDKKTKNQTLEYLTRKKILFEEKDMAQADRLTTTFIRSMQGMALVGLAGSGPVFIGYIQKVRKAKENEVFLNEFSVINSTSNPGLSKIFPFSPITVAGLFCDKE